MSEDISASVSFTPRTSGRKTKRKKYEDFVEDIPLKPKARIRDFNAFTENSDDFVIPEIFADQPVDALQKDSECDMTESLITQKIENNVGIPESVIEAGEQGSRVGPANGHNGTSVNVHASTSLSATSTEESKQSRASVSLQDIAAKEVVKSNGTPAKKRIKKEVISVKTEGKNSKIITNENKCVSSVETVPKFKMKRKYREPETESPRIYTCKKSGCRKVIERCAVKANDACCEATGYSSRWYHLSLEEHYCNACFENYYRNKYEGFEEYHEWKRAWMNNSKADSNFKNISNYISEKQLPYWVLCTKCDRWRQLGNEVEATTDIIRTYVCSMGNMVNTLGGEGDDTQPQRTPHIKYSCNQSNDKSVDIVLQESQSWMSNLNYAPFLKFSLAAPFLTSYYPDGVGMSAVDINNKQQMLNKAANNVSCPPDVEELIKRQKEAIKNKTAQGKTTLDTMKKSQVESRLLMSPGGRKSVKQPQASVDGVNCYFQPFYKPFERGKALCMRPDVMELDEAKEFPEYVKDQSIYLALRNLVVAFWTLNQKSFLTSKQCCEYVILRGLTRIHLCEQLMPRIIRFATYKGLINSGALHNPPGRALLPDEYVHKDVIVIGAGPAGLGAARQLHNFGNRVTVLEARDRIGGRVHDDWSLNGVCVGTGAQIVNGCINNPMALVAHQLDLKMQVLRPQCDLYDYSGTSVSAHCDKRMDFHFNALLDIIADWRRSQQENSDCSLGEKILEAHSEWKKQSGLTFSEIEERLLHFHIGNLEFACGACLDKVSAFHWDQNETFAQFNGDHTLVQFGFSTLLKALAHELDIKFNLPVSKIDYSFSKENKVIVTTVNDATYKADCVLVTVPLTVLKSNTITFVPKLHSIKEEALKRIGCGCIEKIGLEFSERFWDENINGANYFGHIPSNKDRKGFFSMFYDMPTVEMEKSNVLMSVISGNAVDTAAEMTEREIIDIAMFTLRNIFPDKNVPDPKRYFVTRWKKDPYAQMAYSYIKTGSSGHDYDVLAQSVDNRLYFAGEGTNRHFPQTVTGAYLSGLREAAKIAVLDRKM